MLFSFTKNTIKRYQDYMQTTYGYFLNEEQAELELLSLTDLFSLFKPKQDN
jgi:hypothetical protein